MAMPAMTRAQLIAETTALRQRLAALEAAEASHRGTEEALRQRAAAATAIAEVSQALMAFLDQQEVLELIVDRAQQLLHTHNACLAVPEFEAGHLVGRFVAARGMSASFLERLRRSRHGVLATAMNQRRVVASANIFDDPAFPLTPEARAAVEEEGYHSVLAVPLLAGDHLLGGLGVGRNTVGTFAPEEVELLQVFASQAATALQRAQLFQQEHERRQQLEREVRERQRVQETLQQAQDALEQRVAERTAELHASIEHMHREIAERTRAEAALRASEERIAQHNQELERAVQDTTRDMETLMARMVRQEKLATIGQISGSIAHELRNPLGAIKQSLFFLNRLYRNQPSEAIHPKVPEHLHLIEAEIDAANQVITQLLAVARTHPQQPEWLELQALVDDALQHGWWSQQMQLTLCCDPDPFLFWADRWHMRHVFMNLLHNAADACADQGTVSIRAHVDAETRQYHILVQDTGCGIPADEREHVFEPLYTRKTWGTGLGLSLCKQLIERLGGSITLRSHVGQGTTIHLSLPQQSIPEPSPAPGDNTGYVSP